MGTKRTRAAVIVLALMLLAGSRVEARELLRHSFGGAGWSQSGTGGSLSAPVNFEGARRGAFSFELQRAEGVSARPWETIFELVDDADHRILHVKVAWSPEASPDRPALLFQGGHGTDYQYMRLGLGLWGPVVVLNRPVEPGEWIRVDLTWDDLTRNYAVYVDGSRVERKRGGVDPVRKVWFPDGRAKANTDRKKGGQRAYFESRPLSSFLSRTDALHLGYYESPWPMKDWAEHSPLRSAALDNFAVFVDEVPPPGQKPSPQAALTIDTVTHDAARVAGYSGRLVAGDEVAVRLEGTGGGVSSFDVVPVPDIGGAIPVAWKGWGVYLEDITFFDEDQVDLRDVNEYRVYVSTEPIGEITAETEYTEALEVEEQSYTVERLEPDTPYYIAVMALMDDGTFLPVVEPVQNEPMKEVDGAPGTYEGIFIPGYQHRYAEPVVIGRLTKDEQSAALVSDETMEIDTSLTIEVQASPDELKADENSTAEITVTLTDANDEPVQDHEVRFVLATTSQYTGVVGGGRFADEMGGSLERDFWGETDLFGRVTATYTAGFAAKTAIIVARDMQSNDVGTGHIRTYINATAQLELEAVQETSGKALGYTITVTSSDEWLTADGESEARITAMVALDGMPVEGHRVGFTVSAGSGKIRTVRGETDSHGKARAVYTAGTKIGTVLVRATDHTAGISGTVQIELRSDAPAKIGVLVTPEMLPADGRSTADVAVVVTDINDNPNEGVEVEYAVSIGSGRIRDVDPVTDRNGESSAEYVAGRIPGRVSIEVTVRSTVPGEEELAAAADLATAVLDYDFY